MPETGSGAPTRHRGWGHIQPCPARCVAATTPNASLPVCLQEDVSLSGYQKHVSSCSAPAPLTAAEQELQQIRINEVRVFPAPLRGGGLPGSPGVSVSGLSLGLRRWLILTKLSHTRALQPVPEFAEADPQVSVWSRAQFDGVKRNFQTFSSLGHKLRYLLCLLQLAIRRWFEG